MVRGDNSSSSADAALTRQGVTRNVEDAAAALRCDMQLQLGTCLLVSCWISILIALCVVYSMLLAGASPSEQHTARARAARPTRSDLQQQHALSSRVDLRERARQHAAYPNLEAPASTRAARAAEATSSGHRGCAADAAASEAPAQHSASRHDFEQDTQPSSPVLDPASCDGAGQAQRCRRACPSRCEAALTRGHIYFSKEISAQITAHVPLTHTSMRLVRCRILRVRLHNTASAFRQSWRTSCVASIAADCTTAQCRVVAPLRSMRKLVVAEKHPTGW